MVNSVDLNIGTMCNNNCRFCVVDHSRNPTHDCFEDIEKELEAFREKGVESVAFLGGEATIRRDIIEMISLAKKLGYAKIRIVSNGRMYCYPDFLEKIIKAGVNRFSVSIHAHNASLGDYLSRSKGSFTQTTTGIKNICKMGFSLDTNTVINKLNYKHLPEIVLFLNNLGVNNMHFSVINPMGNAMTNFDEMVPTLTEISPYIKKSLKICDKNNIYLTIDSLPFCILPECNRYKSELYDILTHVSFSKGNERDRFYWQERKKNKLKTKPKKCCSCRYFGVCEGIWKGYAKKFGFKEILPINGVEIHNLDQMKRIQGQGLKDI
ncbi:MAG: radical SAM protein [Candidatus Diapherotrites archaeon]|nr:radical SAM protein [Candidatus Diapherotrites archaeon]